MKERDTYHFFVCFVRKFRRSCDCESVPAKHEDFGNEKILKVRFLNGERERERAGFINVLEEE